MNGFPPLVRVEEMVFEVADDPVADCLRIAPKTVGSPVPEAGGLPPVPPQTLDFARRNHPVRRVSHHQPALVSQPRTQAKRRVSRPGMIEPVGRETVRQDRMAELQIDAPKPSTTALA